MLLDFMEYQESLDLLNSLINRENRALRILDRDIENLKDKISDLQIKLPFTIKIIGTNGKGSVAAMLRAALCENGLKVTSFTSPHLVSVRERIMINGEMISRDQFALLIGSLKKLIFNEKKCSYFEALFIIALTLSVENDSDILILEAGMGGKYDATNSVISDLVCLTEVSLDHMEFLGDTVFQIALDKLQGLSEEGIFITGGNNDILHLIYLRSEISCCEMIYADDLYHNLNFEMSGNGLMAEDEKWGKLFIPLTGSYQKKNLILVLTILDRLKEKFHLNRDRTVSGLSKTSLKGRIEIISFEPLLIVDGSHNRAGFVELCRTLNELYPGRKFRIYMSLFADKDCIGIIDEISSLADVFFITEVKSKRGFCTDMICEYLKLINSNYQFLEIEDAVEEFLSESHDSLATGSLYFAGEILKELTK